jgi:hypothetical protein
MALMHYRRVVEQCHPFVLATDLIAGDLDLEPMGVAITAAHRMNPQARRHDRFVNQIRQLDELTFGPVGMPMPQWVFYDCAVMPGAVFGFGAPAANLEPWVRHCLKVPEGYEGLVPLSTFIAIPMLVPDTWLMYSLCDVNQIAPGAAPEGLVQLTMILGLTVFRVKHLYGTTQWRTPKLRDFARLGPLDVVTAYTPAHSMPRTLTFHSAVTDDGIHAVLSGADTTPTAPLATHLLDVDDEVMLRRLQSEVESGAVWRIVGPPLVRGAYTQVPLRRERREGEAAW